MSSTQPVALRSSRSSPNLLRIEGDAGQQIATSGANADMVVSLLEQSKANPRVTYTLMVPAVRVQGGRIVACPPMPAYLSPTNGDPEHEKQLQFLTDMIFLHEKLNVKFFDRIQPVEAHRSRRYLGDLHIIDSTSEQFSLVWRVVNLDAQTPIISNEIRLSGKYRRDKDAFDLSKYPEWEYVSTHRALKTVAQNTSELRDILEVDPKVRATLRTFFQTRGPVENILGCGYIKHCSADRFDVTVYGTCRGRAEKLGVVSVDGAGAVLAPLRIDG